MNAPFVIAGHDGELITLQFHFDFFHRNLCQVMLSAAAARSLAADLTWLASRLESGEVQIALPLPAPAGTEQDEHYGGE
jgi:hypothetical protein